MQVERGSASLLVRLGAINIGSSTIPTTKYHCYQCGLKVDDGLYPLTEPHLWQVWSKGNWKSQLKEWRKLVIPRGQYGNRDY